MSGYLFGCVSIPTNFRIHIEKNSAVLVYSTLSFLRLIHPKIGGGGKNVVFKNCEKIAEVHEGCEIKVQNLSLIHI